MAESGNRILIANQLAAILIIIFAQPALLMGQQLAVNTPPEILARPTTIAGEMNSSLDGYTALAERNALVVSSNVRSVSPALLVMIPAPEEKPFEHRFWDRENRTLFTMNAALAGADFAITRRNLNHNGKELNPVTRLFAGSTPGLAANFAMETGGVIAVGYLFHKTGHHRLERMTSYVNLSASAFAVSYGLAHR
jgi:hypothetical protein